MKKLCVVGLGYIGLPTAAMFANNGWQVHGVDVNQKAVDMINKGQIHIEEIGLQEMVEKAVECGNLRASTEVEGADCFIIAVPTPHNKDNTANLEYLVQATKSVLGKVQKGNLVIVESTIPPRTINDVVAPLFEEASWRVGEDIFLAHCPERVLPGRILIELVENNRIVGGVNDASTDKAIEVYATFVKGDLLRTSSLSAEMSKLMENTYRDVNIALANELVKISEKLGIDALEVIGLANEHPRVNLHLPGPGVGGHCLAVDPYFIIEKAPDESQLIAKARAINNSMPDFVVEQVGKRVNNSNSKIAVLGLTYKGNIDDVRESPAMEIVEKLLEEGYTLGVHDPHVSQEQVKFKILSFEEAIEDSECILVLTDHNEFKNLDEEVILRKSKQPLVLDTRNCVSINSDEIRYVNFGNLKKASEVKMNSF
ncbi:nucleotide sugar dehydrogenase [Sporosarcina sp. ANT_H38]|uniref:nucleotide sugar dehydrogenase n=1 Tax=Sporosarcina sp. ANT_H38 TaxID=2597358 RepID=UPI0011F19703|nr:nucleotide sugar dehydrogenase [Sporosarcina sp. ANT_H38]KAA0955527.1 nucleotide sugar dehydrogenase [Sporosarcina sp. ANT_H38]